APVTRIGSHCLLEDRREVPRVGNGREHVRHSLVREGRLLTGKYPLRCNHGPQNLSCGVQVRLYADLCVVTRLALPSRIVPYSPVFVAESKQLAVILNFADPEVDQANTVVRQHQDILRIDISVDHWCRSLSARLNSANKLLE